MNTTKKHSPEVRERAVRMVLEHQHEHVSQWAAIASIVAKIGCTAQTLCNWARQAERDAGERPGLTHESLRRTPAKCSSPTGARQQTPRARERMISEVLDPLLAQPR